MVRTIADLRGAWGSGRQTHDAKYAYDAFSRLSSEQESHVPTSQGGVSDTAAPQRTSAFTYAALSRFLQSERHENASAAHIITKTYRHDAFGIRTGMATTLGPAAASDDVAGTFTYGYDLHGSTWLLLQDTGSIKASYAYEPYSKEDVGLSRGDRTPDKQNPFNPFRYTSYRLDSGSGGMQLGNGTRLFSPDFKRFWQRDAPEAARADHALGLSQQTGNRYTLAGGDPLNFTEADGHSVAPDASWGFGAEGVAQFDAPDWLCAWIPFFPGLYPRAATSGPGAGAHSSAYPGTTAEPNSRADTDLRGLPSGQCPGALVAGDQWIRRVDPGTGRRTQRTVHVNAAAVYGGTTADAFNWHIYWDGVTYWGWAGGREALAASAGLGITRIFYGGAARTAIDVLESLSFVVGMSPEGEVLDWGRLFGPLVWFLEDLKKYAPHKI